MAALVIDVRPQRANTIRRDHMAYDGGINLPVGMKHGRCTVQLIGK